MRWRANMSRSLASRGGVTHGCSGTVANAMLPEPNTPRLVGMIWTLLLINVLTFNGNEIVIPFSLEVARIITMGSLVCAVGLAIVLNAGVHLRPNPYLLLLSLLLVLSIASSLRLESGTGALFRCFRGALFLATLWLLSRWWRGDLSFVRYHIRAVGVVLVVVLAGLAIAPGKALPGGLDGRLVGVLWPITAPQVGQYAAVVAGLTVLLWLNRCIHRGIAAWITVLAIGILLLSHTRTAVIALAVALACASLTLVLTSGQARRAIMVTAVLAGLAASAFSSAVGNWLARGQDAEMIDSLTGRQKVWDALLAQPRTLSEKLIGVGLTNKGFNGRSIDSSWLTIYYEQGLVGVTIVAIMLIGLFITAAMRPSSPGRACAVFLILYCAIASYTEVGLGDASPYLLHLAVAASLLSRGAPAVPMRAESPRWLG